MELSLDIRLYTTASGWCAADISLGSYGTWTGNDPASPTRAIQAAARLMENDNMDVTLLGLLRGN